MGKIATVVLTGVFSVVAVWSSSGAAPAFQAGNQDSPPLIPRDLLVDRSALLTIPMSGPTWTNIVTWSDRTEPADPWDNDSNHDVVALAAALRGVRQGHISSLYKARNYIVTAMYSYVLTDPRATSLSVGRNVLSYVLAADLIDLDQLHPQAGEWFRIWLRLVRTQVWPDGRTLAEAHEKRPNNWGLMCGATRIAIDMYLADGHSRTDLVRAKRVFHGWLGNRDQWSGFVFGGGVPTDNSWQPTTDPAQYRGIAPVGATLGGGVHAADGLMPDDQRRVGDDDCLALPVSYPDGWGTTTTYVWEALQGAVMQAHLLARCGYEPFTWESSALDRAVNWLYGTYGFPPENIPTACSGGNVSSATWVPHVFDHYYGTSHAVTFGGKPGKNCGFADFWVKGL